MSLFHFGLRTGGVLFLGPSESPGELEPEFEVLDQRWKIYRKRREVRLPIEFAHAANLVGRAVRSSGLPEISTSSERSVDAGLVATYEALLADFMPPALLISERHELIHIFGNDGRYLKHRPGRAGRDVLELLDSSLRLAVSGAIQQVLNKRKTVVSYRGINVELDSGSERVELTVRSSHPRGQHKPTCLSSFVPSNQQRPPPLLRLRRKRRATTAALARASLRRWNRSCGIPGRTCKRRSRNSKRVTKSCRQPTRNCRFQRGTAKHE